MQTYDSLINFIKTTFRKLYIYIYIYRIDYIHSKCCILFNFYLEAFFPREFAYRNHFFLGVSGVATLCAHIKRRLVGGGV